MIHTVLEHIGGIDTYGIVSIVLFFLLFLAIVGWACGLDKTFLRSIASLPLDQDHKSREHPENSHE